MKAMCPIFLCMMISICTVVSGQGVQGTLIDHTDQTPMEYASVAVYLAADSTLSGGAVTSHAGTFEINDLAPGTYYLLAQFLGYEQGVVENITLTSNETKNLTAISLKPNNQLLSEIELFGDRYTTLHKVDRQVYEAGKFQASQGGTATDVLRNLPATTVNATGEISIRGSTGFVVLLNGRPIQSEASVVLNQLPANSIQNIEIMTAPSAKYDPEGKAGIINIITHRETVDGTYAQMNLRAGLPSIEDYDNAEYGQRYGGDFTINHRKKQWDISLGMSYLRNDISGRREGDVYTMPNDTLTRFPSNGERSFDELNYSGQITLGYAPNPNNSFDLSFYGGKRSKDRTADILYFDNHAIFEGERLYTLQYFNENLRKRSGDFVLGSFGYSHVFKNQSQLSTSFLYEYTLLGGPTTNRNLGWPDTSIILQDEFNTNDNPLVGTQLKLDYSMRPLPIGRFEFGYQFRNLDHTGDFVYERRNNETGAFELVPEFSSEVDLHRQIHSAYGLLSGERGDWSYSAGLRLEYMDRQLDLRDKTGDLDVTYLYNFLQPFPSARLQYALNEEFRLNAAYSRRVQRTTTFKMNPFPEREHSETLEQGDPELLPEFIDLFEIGLVKEWGEQSIYATAYYRGVKNLVNRVNTVYNDTILNRIYSNVGEGVSLGLELGTELQFTDWWKAFAGGNIYHYEIDGTFDERQVNTTAWVYSFNANTTFDLPKKTSLQWSLNYISDRNTAQGEDSRFFSPNLTLRKVFKGDKLTMTLQWLNMDMGLLKTNEQRITTWREGEFFTTTNYVYEVDVIMLNLSYTFNQRKNKAKFIKSEFGAKEF